MRGRVLVMLRRRGARLASFLAVATVAVTALVAVITAPGLTSTALSLHDGGVWVTRPADGGGAGVGEVVPRIRQTGMEIPTPAVREFDLLQDGSDVLLAAAGSPGSLSRVDISNRRMAADSVPLPKGARTALAGGVLALVDEAGSLWVREAATGATSPYEGDGADARLGPGSSVTVGTDGAVYAADTRERRITRFELKGQELRRTGTFDVQGALTKPSHVTVVGRTPAVLLADGRLQVGDATPVDLPDSTDGEWVLQQAGPHAPAVVLAGDSDLISVPLDGGAPKVLAATGSGQPGAPVQLDGCVYAVWSAVPLVSTICEGASEQTQAVGAEKRQKKARLVLRVNRGIVVINDAATGDTYWVDEPGQAVDWTTQVTRTRQRDVQVLSPNESTEFEDRKKRNNPPEPQPDEFGVRPGVPRELPVLLNDRDGDGDVLTIADLVSTPSASIGTVQIIKGGRGLSFTPAADAKPGATAAFAVRVSDGRQNGQVESSVSISVTPNSVNNPPRRLGPAARLRVPSQGSTSVDLLQDWDDPDGDPLLLRCQDTPARTRCRPDGVMTLADPGDPRTLNLPIVVSDGRLSADSRVSIAVEGADEGTILARPDFVTGVARVATVVDVLANDTLFRSGSARIEDVEPYGDLTAEAVADGESVRVKASRETTGYVRYTVKQGSTEAFGLIRYDATEPAGDRPPGAAVDTVLIRPGQTTEVDVLANDVDPDGDVLVLTAVTPPNAVSESLSAGIVDNHTLRIAATQDLPAVTVVPYTVSDGGNDSVGAVVLHLLPDSAEDDPPETGSDEATALVGQVVSVPVLDNDLDPEGQPLALQAELTDVAFKPAGNKNGDVGPQLAVQGRNVQVLAPPQPGRIEATYVVRDAAGQTAANSLVVTVEEPEGENRPPDDTTVAGRAVAGVPIRVAVPTSELDPDGDAVRLVAVTAQGRHGVAAVVPGEPDTFEYTARPGSIGQDTVILQTMDDRGATAEAIATIGVAEPADSVPPVVPLADMVSVRNDRQRSVRIPVLQNDVAAPGEALALDSSTVIGQGEAVDVQAVDSDIVFTVPAGASAPLVATYGVTTATSTAPVQSLVQVVPSPDEPLKAPVAGTDTVTGTPGDRITANVLENDGDPDGSPGGLEVSNEPTAVGPAGLLSRTDGRTLAITPADVPQWGWYRLSDGEGLKTTGLVRVLPDTGAPRLRDGVQPIEMDAGTVNTVRLSDVVDTTGGPVERVPGAEPSASGVEIEAVTDEALTVRAGAERGPAAVTIRLRNPSSRETAHVTIPLVVRSTEDSAPSLRTQTVTVAAESSADVDLEGLTTDDPDDAGRHTYTLTADPSAEGVDAALAGSRLTVTASSKARPGTTSVGLTVTDGKHPAVAGTVLVRVNATLRPPPRAADCPASTTEPLVGGARFSVDVQPCTVNPFPDTPLVVTARAGTAGTAQVTTSGTTVSVTIAAAFSGRLSVPYTVKDEAGRTATGRITARVIGPPGAPGTPRVVGYATTTSVTLQWKAAPSGGGTITGYTVTEAGSGRETQCSTTRCTIDGLSSGGSYAYSVRAANQVGLGPSSAVVRVAADAPPPAPVITGRQIVGDTRVRVSWTMSSPSSPIQKALISVDGVPVRTITYGGSPTADSVVLTEADGLRREPGNSGGSVSIVIENAAGQSPATETTVRVKFRPDITSLAVTAGPAGEMSVLGKGLTGEVESVDVTYSVSGGPVSNSTCGSPDIWYPGEVYEASCSFVGTPGLEYVVTMTATNEIGGDRRTSSPQTAQP